MVSADGSEITPDDPNSENGAKPPEPADDVAAESESETTTVTEESDEESSPAETNGKARRKRKKKQDKTRKQTRIDRLVMEFQPDVVEMENRKVAGGLRWTLYVVILLLGSTIAWATWAKVDRLVIANGKLITTGTPVVMQSASVSPLHIRSVNVKFGDVVHAGDVLVTLDPTMSQADVSKLEAQENGLAAKVGRLRAEQSNADFDISGHQQDPVWLTEQRVFVGRRNEYDAKIRKFAADKRKLEAQTNTTKGKITDLTKRLEIRNKMYETVKKLRRGEAVPETELLTNEIELGFVTQQLNEAKNQEIENEASLEALDKEVVSFVEATRSKINVDFADALQQYTVINEELNKARRADEYVVLSVPDDLEHKEFKVVEVAERSVGSVVKPGDAIVRLVPIDNVTYEAEVKVEGKDVARIRAGDPVRIKLNAFPYMKFGTLDGEIRTISEDAFEEGQAPMIQAFYKVRVTILSMDGLRNVPENTRLMPGMATTAEIKIGRRRVIDYFIYPLFRSLDTSIREP